MAQHGTWSLSNQPLLEQVCSLSWKETLPHHSEILSANRTWEMVPVNSFQGLASFTYLARTCRDVQGLLQQLPLLVFLYAYLIIFSLICRSSLPNEICRVQLHKTFPPPVKTHPVELFLPCSVNEIWHKYHDSSDIQVKKKLTRQFNSLRSVVNKSSIIITGR